MSRASDVDADILSNLSAVANLIPTNTSELTNDSGYISDSDSASIVLLSLSEDTVTYNGTILALYAIFASAKKTFFQIRPNQYHAINFEISDVDMSEGTVTLFTVVGDTKYSLVLSSTNQNTMVGTLRQSSFAAPYAYLLSDGTLVFENIQYIAMKVLAVDADGMLAVDADGLLAVAEGDD